MLNIIRHSTRVEPVVAYLSHKDTLRADYEDAGARVIHLDIPGQWGFVRGFRRLREVVRQEHPDVIHASLFRASVSSRLVRAVEGVPLINSFVNDSYGTDRFDQLDTAAAAKLRVVQLIDRVTAPLVDRFVAVAASIKAASCRSLGIPPEKVTVINRGRVPDVFVDGLDDASVLALRKELGVRPDDLVLLNVGRLRERKGQAELVRALPRILQEHPTARVLIAGYGPYGDTLMDLARSLGVGEAITLLGNRNDVPDLLSIADLFVFPSHWEGQPGALIEALLAGKPTVASDTPMHRDVIDHGETGRLFPVRDADALADEVVRLLSDAEARRAYGRRARADALTRFDVRRIAEQHEALYQSLIEQRQ